MRVRGLLALALAVSWGCSTNADRYDRTHVSAGLEQRSGRTLGPGDGSLPPGIDLQKGLSENDAVTLALWNNPDFQEALTELGLRRADLIQAGMVANPMFSILFPLGPKQLEFIVKAPIDTLWLRPGRIAVAELDCERVSALLVQSGLDLVRDVRSAFADLGLQRLRVETAFETHTLREKISEFVQARLKAGDASENEADAARVEAFKSRADLHRAERDQAALRDRLRGLIGLARDPRVLTFQEPPLLSSQTILLEALQTQALAARPDLRSAELAIEAARERGGLADLELFTFSVAADANGSGKQGFEIGPGLDIPIPIFNQNQGGSARADAELMRAARHKTALQDRIVLEVRDAFRAHAAARQVHYAQRFALPLLEEAVERADRAEKAGDDTRLTVYESRLRLLDSKLREAEAAAEVGRTYAQLERSVGGRIP